MDKTLFELLDKLNRMKQPQLKNCFIDDPGNPTGKRDRYYNALLELGYLYHKEADHRVFVTLSGKEALERYAMEQKLLSLQEQNTELQKSGLAVQEELLALQKHNDTLQQSGLVIQQRLVDLQGSGLSVQRELTVLQRQGVIIQRRLAVIQWLLLAATTVSAIPVLPEALSLLRSFFHQAIQLFVGLPG